jgi:hypothetical protein
MNAEPDETLQEQASRLNNSVVHINIAMYYLMPLLEAQEAMMNYKQKLAFKQLKVELGIS